MLCCSERKRLLLGGSRLPSEQLELSSLLLPFSLIFSTGLPRPPLFNLTTPLTPPPYPPPWIHKTDSCTGCAQKKNKHTLDRLKNLRLCFYAVKTNEKSECVYVRARARVCMWLRPWSPMSLCLCTCHCVVFHSNKSCSRITLRKNLKPKPETNSLQLDGQMPSDYRLLKRMRSWTGCPGAAPTAHVAYM